MDVGELQEGKVWAVHRWGCGREGKGKPTALRAALIVSPMHRILGVTPVIAGVGGGGCQGGGAALHPIFYLFTPLPPSVYLYICLSGFMFVSIHVPVQGRSVALLVPQDKLHGAVGRSLAGPGRRWSDGTRQAGLSPLHHHHLVGGLTPLDPYSI